MQIKTKGDLVRAALRKLGVASDATLTDVEPQSMQDAVDDLEAMMAEWYQDGKASLPAMYSQMMTILLLKVTTMAFAPVQSAPYSIIWPAALLLIMRLRLLPKLSPLLNTEKSFYKQTAISRAKRAPYPSRMPTGSGNSFANLNEWHYFPGEQNADSTTPHDEGNG